MQNRRSVSGPCMQSNSSDRYAIHVLSVIHLPLLFFFSFSPFLTGGLRPGYISGCSAPRDGRYSPLYSGEFCFPLRRVPSPLTPLFLLLFFLLFVLFVLFLLLFLLFLLFLFLLRLLRRKKRGVSKRVIKGSGIAHSHCSKC